MARVPDRNAMAYLGWQGHGNLGDDAIFEAQSILYEEQLVPFPVRRVEDVLARRARFTTAPVPHKILIGGGTIIGRPEWLTRLGEHARHTPLRQSLQVWGAGVEDPSFGPAGLYASSSSMRDWSVVLREAAGPVGVRGPFSRELLQRVDVDAVVVGDPALRLVARHQGDVVPGLILLNVASAEATYTDAMFDPVVLGSQIARACIREGLRVRLFATDPKDERIAEAIHAVVPETTVSRYRRSVQRLLSELGRADVVVSQRLHGNVLAAATGRPFVSIDYRPKCADFAASVLMSEHNLRLGAASGEEVVEHCRFLMSSDWSGRDAYLQSINSLRSKIPRSVGSL